MPGTRGAGESVAPRQQDESRSPESPYGRKKDSAWAVLRQAPVRTLGPATRPARSIVQASARVLAIDGKSAAYFLHFGPHTVHHRFVAHVIEHIRYPVGQLPD